MTTTTRTVRAMALVTVLILTAPVVGATPEPNLTEVPVEVYPLPEGKTVFSAILAHSNGKVYIGASYNVARLIEFDPKTKAMKVVARMTSRALESGGPDLKDPVLKGDRGDGEFPQTKWKSAQDKIHTQLHEGRDGRVYGATHCRVENPGSTRSYGGGHWFAYDPKTGATEDLGWSRRHEGIITCCYDRERHVLYGISWPTGYLFSCKPDEKHYAARLNILGLASSHLDCSSRYIDVVKDGRVYMADGATGDIRVYVPGEGRLHSVLGLTTPSHPSSEVPATLRESPAWRNWWFWGARSPDGMHLFTTGQRGGRLTEIDATKGKWGWVIDHGPTVPWADKDRWAGPYCSGMVFASATVLYHTVGPQLLSYDMKTRKVMDHGRTVLKTDSATRVTLGGGARGADGVLYFYTKVKKKPAIAVLVPVRLEREPTLLRVSPYVVLRPWSERRLKIR